METFTKAEIAKIGKWVDNFVRWELIEEIFKEECYDCGAGDPHLTKNQKKLLDEIQEVAREIGAAGRWRTKVQCACGKTSVIFLDGAVTEDYMCWQCGLDRSTAALIRIWNKELSHPSALLDKQYGFVEEIQD